MSVSPASLRAGLARRAHTVALGLILAMGPWLVWRTWRLQASTCTVKDIGYVLESHVESFSPGESRIRIELLFRDGERVYSGQARVKSLEEAGLGGLARFDQIACWFDPWDPDRSLAVAPPRPLTVGAVCLLFFGGLGVFWFAQRSAVVDHVAEALMWLPAASLQDEGAACGGHLRRKLAALFLAVLPLVGVGSCAAVSSGAAFSSSTVAILALSSALLTLVPPLVLTRVLVCPRCGFILRRHSGDPGAGSAEGGRSG